MHVPVTFPAVDYDNGRLALGPRRARTCAGASGRRRYYTSDPFFAPKNKNEFSVELVRLESNKGTIETEVFGPYNKLFPEPPVIKIPMTLTVAPDGPVSRIEPKGSDAGDAEGRRVVALGRLHVPVQLPREDDGHRPLPPRRRSHPEIALYLSPIHFNPSDLPPSVKITRAGRAREEARLALRPLQDDGLADRHVVDERGDDRRGDVPRGRRAHDRAVPEDDERLPRREASSASSSRSTSSPTASRTASGASSTRSTRVRRREGERSGRRRSRRRTEQMDDLVGDAMKKLGPEDDPHRPVRPRLRDVAALRELQHLARRERVHDAHRRRRPADGPRGALRAGRVLAERGLVEDEGLRDGPRRHLRQPQGPRGQGHRRAGRRVRGRARRDQEEARDPRRPEDGSSAPSRASSRARRPTARSTPT